MQEGKDSVTLSGAGVRIVVARATGKVNYYFASGIFLDNTVAYVDDVHVGYVSSAGCSRHSYKTDALRDSLGKGVCLTIEHSGNAQGLVLVQRISLYQDQPGAQPARSVNQVGVPAPPFVTVQLLVRAAEGGGVQPETRDISPLAILPSQGGLLSVPGSEPRLLDVPFDNDDWVNDVERKWPAAGLAPNGAQPSDPAAAAAATVGISYELSAVYDNAGFSGIVMGSLTHDFWKTGIAYRLAIAGPSAVGPDRASAAAPDHAQAVGPDRASAARPAVGLLDSLRIFGGAATADNPSLPADDGGRDGTHDHAPHGTMTGPVLTSPLVYLGAADDVRKVFTGYGEANARLNGRLSWSGYAPVYWNSFGVEGVLGYEGVMMPPGVTKISDFIHSMAHFNAYARPVLSIDSYDQNIYSTDMLASLGRYAAKQGQQMGFYFTPFALWTWKNTIDQGQLAGTNYTIRDVVLKDMDGEPIQYKNGDWAAYALDPTHPAVRESIIRQLQKAKAIGAKFLKIDFLTAGAMESVSHYDPSVRSGIQAYNQGMKMLHHLVDSILGPDIFITQAISPMFPSQYAHTRFVSTDVYSHLRGDQKGFPSWGSTEASLAIGSHMWWVQGTLWPFTNLDVIIMQHFQKNPDLNEQEIRVRLYALMVMGSILGDGSDFRSPLARQRAEKLLNNPEVDSFFSHPRAFTPLKWADGTSMDQQMVFCLESGAPSSNDAASVLLGLFNFSKQGVFTDTLSLKALHLPMGRYSIRDFLTGEVLGYVEKDSFVLNVPEEDALMIRLVRDSRRRTPSAE